MKHQKTQKRLNWKYCECGCKGYELTIGGRFFWSFYDLKGGWYLTEGHGGYGTDLGKFKSWEKADEKLLEILRADGTLDKLKNQVTMLEEVLGETE